MFPKRKESIVVSKNVKRNFLKTCFVFAILFVSIVCVGNVSVFAANYTIKASQKKSVVSTELSNVSCTWKLNISGQKISVELKDDKAQDGTNTLLSVENTSVSQWGKMQKGTSSLSIDVSSLEDGKYGLIVWEGKTNNPYGSVWDVAEYKIKKKNGKVKFYFAAGASETSFYNQISKLNPEDYTKPSKSCTYNVSSADLKAIQKKAKKITKNCKTDEEKVLKIHDWIAKNIAYDYEAYYSGRTSASATAGNVFNNKRAVCSGYSRLARIMFNAVGIPCVNITGFAAGIGTSGEITTAYRSNHEWNSVYINDKWYILDITWDSDNKYYGNGDLENVIGQPAGYTYYGIPAYAFGTSHLSYSFE